MNREKTYDAFISYKHDFYISKIAHTVLRRLEHYRPPKGSGAQKKRLYLCIDDQNFATAGNLNKQIREALENSEYLIYLACPETLESGYCLDEIRYFKKLHDGRLDNIIALLIKGEPKDVFPRELCYEGCWETDGAPDPDRKTEIHWLDLRAGTILGTLKRLKESLLMIAAPLLHCELDELIQRDKQWKKQKRRMWGMLGAAMLLITLCVGYTFWLTWLVDYKRQAENALANGNDNKALFYYAKALSLNPMDEQTRINAQLLLQKESWPMVVQEDKESVILGNRVYPVDAPADGGDALTPMFVTAKDSYILWTDEKGRYYFSDAERTFLEELPDVGSFFSTGWQRVSDAWCFRNYKEPHYTFYWPEEKRMERLEWKENFSGEWENVSICALQPGMIAISDWESLSFCQLENGVCRELYRVELNEIFGDDQSLLEEYNISLMENYTFDVWTSPDGSYLVMTANFWYNSGREAFCRSAAVLFDTKTHSVITSVESSECLISHVTFQNDSQRMALIYSNEDGFLENRSYVSVYDVSGSLVFQTECGGNIIPSDAYFCGEVFLLCDFSTVYFLDAKTGRQLCEPLLLHVNEAVLAEDGKIALECVGASVKYCRFIQYSAGGTEANTDNEDILNELQSEMEMKHQIAEDLWLLASDNREEVLLADGNNTVLDRFRIAEMGTGNFVIDLAYGVNTQTAFVLDENHTLYCPAIDRKLKRFAAKEKIPLHEGVLAFDIAKEGVVYLDGFFPGHNLSRTANLKYIVGDDFIFTHDSAVNYLGWLADPNINDSFLGLISGESDYVVIFTQKEGQINFRFISIKTGDILADMSHGQTDDLLVNLEKDNTVTIRSDGNWRKMWLGLCRADYGVTRQLMDLSGYRLSGSRFGNEQKLEYAEAVMSPDSFGGWSKYLEWTSSVLTEPE